MRGALRRWLRRAIWTCVALALVITGFALWPHAPLAGRWPQSTIVRDRDGELLRLTLASDQRYRLWAPLADIDPRLIDAVLLKEDQWFYWHPGFNPVSLVRGAWQTYVRGGLRQGGSTLSMQLARLLWRLNTRSAAGKLKQIARAVELELKYSKREILEAYLNYAPFGGNIEGVRAACLVYFGKEPKRLTLPEALSLAVLPQDPASRRLLAPDGQAGPELLAARDRLFADWLRQHPADADRTTEFQLPLLFRSPRQLPFAAPHLVDQLLAARRHVPASADAVAASPALTTTIDLDLQRALEDQVRRYLKRRNAQGLNNAAAIIVDSRDAQVRALLGSADFFDRRSQGQVDGTRARRSPGSTLKPFIYALALDQGVLHPQTVLRDVPTAFGPFSPENFDGRFLGPVTATQALVRSRNIPAVQVAARLSQPSFYQFLKSAGIERMASEAHYGLALVLGGGEVSLLELARLYTMLARGGELVPLRLRADEPLVAGPRLLSREASWLTLDMLRSNPRPDQPTSARQRLKTAWKTGTSWGFRDAWTAGVVGPYVVVVWLGNFDGSGNNALIGIEAAAPLWFELADRLAAREPGLADLGKPAGLNLKRVDVCAASGDLPNTWCPQRSETWFIPGVSPIRVSTVHRAVVVDLLTGLPACPPHDPTQTRTEVYEYWPSELAQVFIEAGIPRRRPPPQPACGRGGEAGTDGGQPPQITAPLRATTYTLKLGARSRLPLDAHYDAAVRTLYWFAGDDYLGAAQAGAVLDWEPRGAGLYTLKVIDDHGRLDTRRVEVTYRP